LLPCLFPVNSVEYGCFPMAMANPEHTRQERFIAYAHLLKERFDAGCLAELQPLPHWVVWKAELDEGKSKKVPYNPNYRLARASVKLPTSWGSLPEALSALESGNFSGIGFMITPPLVLLDLDHSVDKPTGTITDPQAAEIVRDLNSYTEVSPSRTGLHILAYASVPGKNIHTAIELYGQDRFTTITTNHFAGTPATIEQRQDAIASLYHRFAPPVHETIIQNTSGGVRTGTTMTELPGEAAHDAVLQRLLAGDITGYPSQSNADFVLVLKLLHWTGDDVVLTRRLFLASGLYRPGKTERKTGQTDYLDMTINNAIKKRRNPPQKR
jgi:putative DNA primase/helicase